LTVSLARVTNLPTGASTRNCITDTDQGARHVIRRCRALYCSPCTGGSILAPKAPRANRRSPPRAGTEPCGCANLCWGGAIAGRTARDQAKLKGGIRCFDAKSLHVLRRAPLTPPEPFHPKAFRSTQLRLPEPFVADAPPSPKTLRREHSSRSQNLPLRTLRRIRRPFVANAPRDPRTLCCGRYSGSEDPSLCSPLRIR